MSYSCECCVLSGKGLCDGLIPRPEESYRVCVCVCVCVRERERESVSVMRCSSTSLYLQRVGRSHTKTDRNTE
jgi:hypothetical protein